MKKAARVGLVGALVLAGALGGYFATAGAGKAAPATALVLTPRPSFAKPQNYPTAKSPNGVAIGDLNGDGKPDVAVGSDLRTVSLLVNRGNGHFEPRVDYRTGPSENGAGPRSLAIGDLNSNHKLDVVTTKEPASVAVLLNTTPARH